MTLVEIQAQWVRYMHRNDLTADMAATTVYARNLIGNRIMRITTDAEIDTLMVDAPQLWLNAGLIWLAELAMDNDTLARSMDRFTSDINDYQIAYSINFVEPIMIPR